MPNTGHARHVVLLAISVYVVVIILVVAGVVASRTRRARHGTVAQTAAARFNPDIDLGSPTPDIVAPGFTLVDQHDQTTTLAQFRGKVVVLAFIDSHCTTICPLTTQSMVDALRLLGPAAQGVQLIGVDANPLATRVADVAAYTQAHDLQRRWRFVTGTSAQLRKVWREYHVYVAAVHNDIDHTPVIYLIGRRGHERRMYMTQMSYEGVPQQAQLLAQGIARLLPGDPSIPHTVALRYLQPISPSQAVTMYGAGHTRVTLGPDHPHLVLFFAGWLRESGALAPHLAVLDAYARTARSRGWPAPVLVNELSTEVSVGTGRRLVAHLAGRLQVPIIEDAAGRLADGYQVQDLPWFVLVSNAGKVIWQHGGWLAAGTLVRDVAAILGTPSRLAIQKAPAIEHQQA